MKREILEKAIRLNNELQDLKEVINCIEEDDGEISLRIKKHYLLSTNDMTQDIKVKRSVAKRLVTVINESIAEIEKEIDKL